jgi:hypothetical protein
LFSQRVLAELLVIVANIPDIERAPEVAARKYLKGSYSRMEREVLKFIRLFHAARNFGERSEEILRYPHES